MKRHVGLRRSRKGLRPKGGARFPKGVDEDYREWIRKQPCLVTKARTGEWWWWPSIPGRPDFGEFVTVEACHVRSRGAGGKDVANLVPLASFLHREQHTIGIRSFERKYGINLKAAAEALAATYEETE